MSKLLLTKHERKALVVLHSNASHGPWAYEPDGDSGDYHVGVVLGDNDNPISGYSDNNTRIVVDVVAREVNGGSNAAFVVEAYNVFPRLLYSLEVLDARLEDASAEIQRLRRLVSAQENYMQSTVSAIFKADIPGSHKHIILNDKQRISSAVTVILARNPVALKTHEGNAPTSCPICGGSGHIGDCEED